MCYDVEGVIFTVFTFFSRSFLDLISQRITGEDL